VTPQTIGGYDDVYEVHFDIREEREGVLYNYDFLWGPCSTLEGNPWGHTIIPDWDDINPLQPESVGEPPESEPTPPPPYEGEPPDCTPSADCPICLLPDPLYVGQPTRLTVIVSDQSYVREGGVLVFFVRPYGSEPKDVPDGEAPELNEFVPDERAGTGFYKEGIAYVGIDLPLQAWGDVWVGELTLIPQEGMEFAGHNALLTDACLVIPQYASGDPPQDYPFAQSQMD
jgi:hypothetical protein